MNQLIRKLNTNFGIMLGRIEHLKLKIYARNVNKVQEILLKMLMKKNQNILYGENTIFLK